MRFEMIIRRSENFGERFPSLSPSTEGLMMITHAIMKEAKLTSLIGMDRSWEKPETVLASTQ
jgi:hypothetical protein